MEHEIIEILRRNRRENRDDINYMKVLKRHYGKDFNFEELGFGSYDSWINSHRVEIENTSEIYEPYDSFRSYENTLIYYETSSREMYESMILSLNDSERADYVFRNMIARGYIASDGTLHHLLYISISYDKALGYYGLIKIVNDNTHYLMVLKSRTEEHAFSWYNKIKEPTVLHTNTLISRCNNVAKASYIMSKMSSRNVVTYNAVASVASRNSNWSMVKHIYSAAKKANRHGYTLLLEAAIELHDTELIYKCKRALYPTLKVESNIIYLGNYTWGYALLLYGEAKRKSGEVCFISGRGRYSYRDQSITRRKLIEQIQKDAFEFSVKEDSIVVKF